MPLLYTVVPALSIVFNSFNEERKDEAYKTLFNNPAVACGGFCRRLFYIYMGSGKMTDRTKTVICHILSVTVILGSVLYGTLVLTSSYVKLGLSVLSLGKSLLFYFASILGLKSPFPPTANMLPPSIDVSIIPGTPMEFGERWRRFSTLFIDINNLKAYSAALIHGMAVAAYAILAAIPLLVLLLIAFATSDKTVRTGRIKDSMLLKVWKWFSHKIIQPIFKAVKYYTAFIKKHKPYRIIFLCVWGLSLNLATICFGILAFYFYFAASFDLVSIYTNLVRLFSDLRPFFSFLPWWVYPIVALFVFDRIRKNIAIDRLRHMEMRNRGFLNSLPVAVMFCGTMGTGKTALMTDATLSRQATFRDVARDKLLELQMQFPDFPWLYLEREIIAVVGKGIVRNLARCRLYIRHKAARHACKPEPRFCWGYDVKSYASTYDDKLAVKELWERLEVYAQLFFIYITVSSIIASNYSIRDDSLLAYKGNFPMWNSDFVTRDSRTLNRTSRYSHILDFDALRLNKQVMRCNPHTGSFEFGVIAITEVGKERGNQNDTKGVVKMTDADANRVNDGFNRWLKMCRHAATVEHFPFISVYMDDQRPQSLNADAKELCSLIHIYPGAEQRIAIPFFWFGEWLYSKFYGKLAAKHLMHRYRRCDRTLGSYIVHRLASALYKHYSRLYSLYGYKVQALGVENGTQDGKLRDAVYYLVNKKIYSKRYDTACFADVFAAAAVKTDGGINVYPEYATVRASWSELALQHSYFIDEINIGGGK